MCLDRTYSIMKFYSVSVESSIWTPTDTERASLENNKIDVVVHTQPECNPQQVIYNTPVMNYPFVGNMTYQYITPYSACAPYPSYVGMINCIQLRLQKHMKDTLNQQNFLSERRKQLIATSGDSMEIETLTQEINALTLTMLSLQSSMCNMYKQ